MQDTPNVPQYTDDDGKEGNLLPPHCTDDALYLGFQNASGRDTYPETEVDSHLDHHWKKVPRLQGWFGG